MRRVILLAALLAGGPRAVMAAPDVIEVGERTPLAFVLVTPTGEAARIRSSDLIRMIDDGARRMTSFTLRSGDDGIAQGCRGRLLCLVLRLRPDYERDYLRDGDRVRPYSDHLRELAERGVSYPRWLLLITNVTREGEADRMSAQLIDTDSALAKYHEASRDDAYWEANVEASINESARSSPRVEVRDNDGARAFVEALFGTHLRPSLEANGQWQPYGHIALEATMAGLTILLDDASIGVTTAGEMQLDGILPGRRRLTLDGAEIAPYTTAVEVTRGEVVAVAPQLSLRPSSDQGSLHLFLEIAGATAVVAGGVVLAVAAGTPDGELRTYCVVGAVEGCASASLFATTDYDPARAGLVNGAGLPLAPLGISLIAGGATWGIGTLLLDDRELPWLPFVVGTVLGIATYVVSTAVAPAAFEVP